MKLPPLKLLKREDIPEAPGWIIKLIDVINPFFERVYQALDRNLTFTENTRTQIREFLLQTRDLPYKFSTNIDAKGLIKMYVGRAAKDTGYHIAITDAVSIDWTYESGVITIHNISGLTAGLNYDVRLLIM